MYYCLKNDVLEALRDKEIKSKNKKVKTFTLKHLARVYIILIHSKVGSTLSNYHDYEFWAKRLGIKCEYPRLLKSRVKKALDELYPTIEYEVHPTKGLKITRYPEEEYIDYWNSNKKTNGFTKLFCDLHLIEGIEIEHIVIFTQLEYYKGKSKDVFPSLDTLCEDCKCSKPTLLKYLKEMDNLDIIKIISRGGHRNYPNHYILTDDAGRYLYINELDKQQKLNSSKPKILKRKTKKAI